MVSKRRSAAEWKRLVAAWDQSGLTAAEFAGRRGILPGTLSWWKWRLRKLSAADGAVSITTPTEEASEGQRLVRVVPVEDCNGTRNPEQQVAWELSSPSGCVLRVFVGAESDSSAVTATARALLSTAKPGSE